MSILCHLIGFFPALRARSNIKCCRLVPGLMELGKHLPDVCSCFLLLPVWVLGWRPTSAAPWSQSPRFWAKEAGLLFSYP